MSQTDTVTALAAGMRVEPAVAPEVKPGRIVSPLVDGRALKLFGRLENQRAGTCRANAPQVLRLTRDANCPPESRPRSALLLDGGGEAAIAPRRVPDGFGAVFLLEAPEGGWGGQAAPAAAAEAIAAEAVALPADFGYLDEGDVIKYVPATGELQTVYRRSSPFNHLFVTERCNSKCLMCSQPPREVDDGFRVADLLDAIPLMDPASAAIGFTGGEITLLHGGFLELLNSCKQHLPRTHVQVLTNGRLFSYLPYAERVADAGIESLVLCVPLYSDIDARHDFVVQARGAFDQTIRGILNLGRVGVPVEIRVVIHRQTYERLPQLAEFIARNLPFVSHVALMGMEMTGFTRANLEALWIDPVEYVPELMEAVEILDAARVRTSIYNHQLCLLPNELWRFSRQSISDWKNIYLPACEDCAMRPECGGFFASATLRHSAYIRPFDAPIAILPGDEAGGSR